MTTLTTDESEKKKRNQLREEARHIFSFLRAAKRLRELTTTQSFNMKLEWEPAIVQPADPRQRVMASIKLSEPLSPLVIDTLAIRLRPFTLEKEHFFFPYIVKRLSRHVRIENAPMTFEELSAAWHATMRDTSAPIPAGTTWTKLVPGFTAEMTREGRMRLMVDHELLTGEEVLDLLFNGEVAHRDRDKEKKLKRIRESQIAPGFEVAVVAIATKLSYLIDLAGMYAEAFRNELPPETIADIEENTP